MNADELTALMVERFGSIMDELAPMAEQHGVTREEIVQAAIGAHLQSVALIWEIVTGSPPEPLFDGLTQAFSNLV